MTMVWAGYADTHKYTVPRSELRIWRYLFQFGLLTIVVATGWEATRPVHALRRRNTMNSWQKSWIIGHQICTKDPCVASLAAHGSFVQKNIILDLLVPPWGTIFESFLQLRTLLDPTVATFGLPGQKNLFWTPKCWKIRVHFGHMFGPKLDKSHKQQEKVGARKASRTKIAVRLLPK